MGDLNDMGGLNTLSNNAHLSGILSFLNSATSKGLHKLPSQSCVTGSSPPSQFVAINQEI